MFSLKRSPKNEDQGGAGSKAPRMSLPVPKGGRRGVISQEEKNLFTLDQQGTARLLELLVKANLNLMQRVRVLEGVLQDQLQCRNPG